ncbi:membrane protein [Zafaria cholistanensis]|uniref:Membrane protein n=1 Tax=Zafaria cholistanensis TaxID=1682741 RepID=A0A5A7NMZ4_9MICC|nr:DUF4870 domain-containing protein [Zafaria cholistanensis]GER22150.1 membrane protein [Zafaria cholistanensis]
MEDASVTNGHPDKTRDGAEAAGRFEGSSPAPLPLTPSEDRQWAMISHFGCILGFLPAAIIYYVYRDRGPFTAQESKEALNFALPLTVLAMLANLLALIPFIGGFFAILAVGIWLYLTVSGVVAGIETNKGRPYRYLLNFRMVK